MLEHFNVVFVVLVYRNTEDLMSFFDSLFIEKSKVIVVNSFYDEQSELAFKTIALNNNADFISVPNKGYGAGNNRGCEYALQHYKFDFLIISNADVEIKVMDVKKLSENRITAPQLINKKGKRQNPAQAYHLPKYEWLMYLFYKKKLFRGVYLLCLVNKISREIFFLTNVLLGCKKISQAHGAFLIFPYNVLSRMYPLFNEEMFLFAEEDHLSMLSRINNVEMEYNKNVIIHHKEDGSVSLLNVEQMEITRDSYIKFYEYWRILKCK